MGAAVASSPTRRKQGLIKALLTECLRDAAERQVPISMLGTSRPAIYEGMGWAVTDRHYYLESSLIRLAGLKNLGNAEHYAMVDNSQFEMAAGLRDPLAVTCSNGESGLTPGQVVQLVTNFWTEPPKHWPRLDLRIVPRAFSSERF